MNDDLKIIIAELEAEKENLNRLIDEAVKETDFLTAHFHQEALINVNALLYRFRNFEDGSYAEKQSLQDTIVRMEEYSANLPERMKKFVGKQLEQLRRQLEELNQQPKKAQHDDHTIVYNLNLTVISKIKGFRIVLSRKPELIIEVRRTSKNIVLKIWMVNDLGGGDINKLTALGFKFSDKKGRVSINFPHETPELVNSIMTLLSRIIFDILPLGNPRSQKHIEILQ